MLIGKTANWLLRHSVQHCVERRRLVCAHARKETIEIGMPYHWFRVTIPMDA